MQSVPSEGLRSLWAGKSTQDLTPKEGMEREREEGEKEGERERKARHCDQSSDGAKVSGLNIV